MFHPTIKSPTIKKKYLETNELRKPRIPFNLAEASFKPKFHVTRYKTVPLRLCHCEFRAIHLSLESRETERDRQTDRERRKERRENDINFSLSFFLIFRFFRHPIFEREKESDIFFFSSKFFDSLDIQSLRKRETERRQREFPGKNSQLKRS